MTPLIPRPLLRRLVRPAYFGIVRRTTPISASWGRDRGTPIDRYYIERFLAGHSALIQGQVLEVMDRRYTRRFGSAVLQSDILDIDPTNPDVTVVADLTVGDGLPSGRYDCFILTQTLQFIDRPEAALAQAYRLLRPGGVLLATVPSVSRLDRRLTDYWRFTIASCRVLFGHAFHEENLTVESHGNVLAAMAFLTGLAAEELSPRELDTPDELFPVIITVKAVRPREDPD